MVIVFTLKALETVLARTSDTAFLGEQGPPLLKFGVARVDVSSVALFFVHKSDSSTSPRVVFATNVFERLSELPVGARRLALQRAHRYALANQTVPARVPVGWGSYHWKSLVAFYACNEALGGHRWVAESIGTNVAYWQFSSGASETVLQDVTPRRADYEVAESEWPRVLDRSHEALAGVSVPSSLAALDGSIDLTATTYGAVVGHQTYSGWLAKLTPDQRHFVEHDDQVPLKLRGVAGTGKTLSLQLKALRELYSSAPGSMRILFATHSWAMAEQVDAGLRSLDEKGRASEIDVLPLIEIAHKLMPADRYTGPIRLLGEDSLSGRRLLLGEISLVLALARDVSLAIYRPGLSLDLAKRLDARVGSDLWNSLVWDLMHEFSSVISASGILPGLMAEKRYLEIRRSDWMMPLETQADRRFVLRVYSDYVRRMRSAGQLSTDQLISDFLGYLETFAWDYGRETSGYDLILVDEFHLFSDQERHVLSCLSRDPTRFPRVLLALDPRQSPSEIYADFPVSTVRSSADRTADEGFGRLQALDLAVVYRFSPQVLELVRFIHNSFPQLQLGKDWVVNVDSLSSAAPDSALPVLFQYTDSATEVRQVAAAAERRFAKSGSARIAVVLVDAERLDAFHSALEETGLSVVCIQSKDDVDTLRYSKRSVVLAPWEYVAGLQFDDVLVAGFPVESLPPKISNPALRRVLSSLYVAVSRASREVEIHYLVNAAGGDISELVQRAITGGVLSSS